MACQGIYADVQYTNNGQETKDREKLSALQEEYNRHKLAFSENWMFKYNDRYNEDLVDSMKAYPYQPLHVVQIFFDTATFDEVERDVKVTLEGQLGVIGGTMGLFAGFSILSGVEIAYFALKLFLSMLNKYKV